MKKLSLKNIFYDINIVQNQKNEKKNKTLKNKINVYLSVPKSG